jgi:putative ABC transport system permease protein
VVAIVDNATPGQAGPQASYLDPRTAAEMVKSAGTTGGLGMTYTTCYVRVAEPGLVPSVQTQLSAQGFAVSSVGEQLRSLSGLFKVLSLAGWIFGALLLLLCLAVGGAMGSAWIRQRTRELGLLKAIGWSRRRILVALMLELAAVGAGGAVAGVVLGVLGSLTGTALIAGLRLDLLPVDPWGLPSLGLLAAAVVGVPLCVSLGGLRSALRAVDIDADDALRDL